MSVDRVDGSRTHQSVRGPAAASDRANLHADKASTSSRAESHDSVSLSGRAQELRSALKAVQAASDVREDKVAGLRERIANGTYQVPAETLARDILRRG